VLPDGTESAAGHPAWFLPGKFRFCPTCSQTHDARGRDGNRLASLSAEGRSSATTVLVSSVLRWFHEPEQFVEPDKRKLLGFTDNRQDAALQAGHFNDFIFVSLFRAATLRALHEAGDRCTRFLASCPAALFRSYIRGGEEAANAFEEADSRFD
jgi:hypothetical protein